MGYRALTLRHMPPDTRKLAHLINDLESVNTRLKNFIPILMLIEQEASAFKNITFPPVCPHEMCEYRTCCVDDPQRSDYCPLQHLRAHLFDEKKALSTPQEEA